MADWPSTLPQSVFRELMIKRQPGKARSPMDTGPAKQRPRFTAAIYQNEAGLHLTGAQLATFRTFYETTLGQGAASFTWIDPVTDAPATLRFMDEPEEQLIRPHHDPAERLYFVKLPLEVLP